MAQKRMFDKSIVESDAFLDMPLSAQALYFHLNMSADDDGFVNSPKRIQRGIGASEDDFKLLIAKNFILTFESGVIVIKGWKINNYIPKDRYKETLYQDEKSLLWEKENKSYTFCIQSVYSLDTQNRLDKIKLDKIKLDKISIVKSIKERLTDSELKEVEKLYPDTFILFHYIDKRVDPNEIEHPFEYIKKIIQEEFTNDIA